MDGIPEHRYRGAAALVHLHEREMRAFLEEWRAGRDRGVRLPPSDDPDCASLDTLLAHVIEAATGYLRRIAISFDLPEPALPQGRTENDLEPLLAVYRDFLVDIEQERFFEPHPTSWGDLNVEVMLEHAVVHPMRHRLQLAALAD